MLFITIFCAVWFCGFFFFVLNYFFFWKMLWKNKKEKKDKKKKKGKRKPAAVAAQPNPLPASPVAHLTSLGPLFSPRPNSRTVAQAPPLLSAADSWTPASLSPTRGTRRAETLPSPSLRRGRAGLHGGKPTPSISRFLAFCTK